MALIALAEAAATVPTLAILKLGGNGVGTDGARELCALPPNPNPNPNPTPTPTPTPTPSPSPSPSPHPNLQAALGRLRALMATPSAYHVALLQRPAQQHAPPEPDWSLGVWLMAPCAAPT